MDDLRQIRISKARVIVQNRQFIAASYEEKARVLHVMLDKGMDHADLKMVLDEQKNLQNNNGRPTAKTKFEILDKGVLSHILRDLSPRDVLKTCQMNVQYQQTCRDPTIFNTLLLKHYPQAFATDNPKRQYIALTQGVQTIYSLYITDDGYEAQLYHKASQPEYASTWNLDTLGLEYIESLLDNPIFWGWLVNKNPETSNKVQTLRDEIAFYNETKLKDRRFVTMLQLQDSKQILSSHFSELFRIFMRDYRQDDIYDFVKKPIIQSVLKQETQKRLHSDQKTQNQRIIDEIDRYGSSSFYDGLTEDELLQVIERDSTNYLQQKILGVLQMGNRKTVSSQKHLILDGVEVPRGSIVWIALGGDGEVMGFPDNIDTSTESGQAFKSKKDLVEQIMKTYFEKIQEIILNNFNTYLHYNQHLPGAHIILDMYGAYRMQTPLFQEWLQSGESSFGGLKAVSREDIRNYLLENDTMLIPMVGPIISIHRVTIL